MTNAISSGTTEQLYNQEARNAMTEGETLEMIALKSLATGSQDDLFKEFGFDNKKVTFEAERYLGKPMKPSNSVDATQSRLDRPPVMTENPFASDLTDLS